MYNYVQHVPCTCTCIVKASISLLSELLYWCVYWPSVGASHEDGADRICRRVPAADRPHPQYLGGLFNSFLSLLYTKRALLCSLQDSTVYEGNCVFCSCPTTTYLGNSHLSSWVYFFITTFICVYNCDIYCDSWVYFFITTFICVYNCDIYCDISSQDYIRAGMTCIKFFVGFSGRSTSIADLFSRLHYLSQAKKHFQTYLEVTRRLADKRGWSRSSRQYEDSSQVLLPSVKNLTQTNVQQHLATIEMQTRVCYIHV